MYLQKCADTLHPNLSDFCHYIRFYRICRRKPHKRISFFPYHSPRCGVNLFRIRYCSQELVCEAIVVPRTLSNYVEAILWGATETKKSLRVNLCRKLLRHSTRKDSVSDRKANTNRFTTFGGCHRNREGECFLAPQGFCPE